MEQTKIGLFGGSFDPPHLGHLRLAERLVKATGAETVYIVPAASSPFKNGCSAPAEDRLEMCRLAFLPPLYRVLSLEIERGGKSYTIETVRYLKEQHPNAELFLFMGSDMFLSLDHWHCANELLSLCIPAAACRDGSETVGKLKNYAEQTLGLTEDRYVLSPDKPLVLSSTFVRETLKNGGSTDGLLGKSVEDYIKKKEFYVSKSRGI